MNLINELRFVNVRFKGGGGGGSSGQVSYPAYIQAAHNDWLDDTGSDTLSTSITAVMDAAIGNSPFAGLSAYDPIAEIAAMVAATTELQDLVTLLSTGTPLDTLVSDLLDPVRLDTMVAEFSDDFDADLIARIYPRFEAGMRDINAVNTSAFVIGRALIEESRDREVGKFSAQLHLKASTDDALKLIGLKLEGQKAASQMVAEVERIAIVARKEESDSNASFDEADARWDLEVFQYGANLLGAAGGSAAGIPNTKKPSAAASAIGGALSGAAAGTMIMPGWGTAIGAVAGAAMSLLQ